MVYVDLDAHHGDGVEAAFYEITGHPLDPDTEAPESWLDRVRRRTGSEGPKCLTDGTEPAYHPWDAGEGDPDAPVDRAIAATRRAVSPITASTTSIPGRSRGAPLPGN